MEAAVRYLRPHRAGGHTHLRVDHFKQRQGYVYPREQPKTPPWREHRLCLIDIVQ